MAPTECLPTCLLEFLLAVFPARLLACIFNDFELLLSIKSQTHTQHLDTLGSCWSRKKFAPRYHNF